MNVGVLVSGSGTNLQSLLDAQAAGALGRARIVVVGANVPGCGGLARATASAIPTFVLDHRDFRVSGAAEPGERRPPGEEVAPPSSDRLSPDRLSPDRLSPDRLSPDRLSPDRLRFDRALVAELRSRGVELVVLAGFMRILTPVFLSAFPARVINIHPSLLPAFPGVSAQAQAFRHGVKVTGCTVHFVETGVDSGPIIAQAAVALRDGDDVESLRLRILAEEHKLLPAVVRAISEGRVTIDGRRVETASAPAENGGGERPL